MIILWSCVDEDCVVKIDIVVSCCWVVCVKSCGILICCCKLKVGVMLCWLL